MNATDFLANVRVAAPCSARWADMTGDARTRFCAGCQKHVYNLSEMTAEAAANLVREKEGRLCVRFYRRADGTLLTADCPVGTARVSRRFRRLVFAAVPLLLAGALVRSWASGGRDSAAAKSSPGKLTVVIDHAVWKVKGWLGIQPSPVMGGMCAPRPNPTPPPQPPPASAVTGA